MIGSALSYTIRSCQKRALSPKDDWLRYSAVMGDEEVVWARLFAFFMAATLALGMQTIS